MEYTVKAEIARKELVDFFAQNGIEPGWTARPNAIMSGLPIDMAVAEQSECSKCGYIALDYMAFTDGDINISVAICPSCGWSEEF